MAAEHCAKFNDTILQVLKQRVPGGRILDPFAGTGRVHEIAAIHRQTWGIEIEPEWADMHPRTLVGDATNLPFRDRSFDCIVTSPTYGNRMADHHDARDSSKRYTYTHTLGRKLHPRNTGAMQWGKNYRAMHELAWAEAARVCRGWAFINVKNFPKRGQLVDITSWHQETLKACGFQLVETLSIPVPGMNHRAQNSDPIKEEVILVMTKMRSLSCL